MKVAQWSDLYWLRSLMTHTYVDIKVPCDSGSLKSPLSFIFSALKCINLSHKCLELFIHSHSFLANSKVTYLLSFLTLGWSRLQIYFRIYTFLLELPQGMSTTILIHLHFSYILKSQPCNPVWTASVQNVEQKATLAPGLTNEPRT